MILNIDNKTYVKF